MSNRSRVVIVAVLIQVFFAGYFVGLIGYVTPDKVLPIALCIAVNGLTACICLYFLLRIIRSEAICYHLDRDIERLEAEIKGTNR